MSVTVVNAGVWERTSSGQRNTKKLGPQGEVGTITVVVENQAHTFGPGQSKTFSDDGYGIKVAAADARLRVADSREGFKTTGRS